MSNSKEDPSFQPMKRVRYFHGQVLSAGDLQAEQSYFREKMKLHNRCLHGAGIACGLEVRLEENRLVIQPGMALDCTGNEIIVPQRVEVPLGRVRTTRYLLMRYLESETELVPTPGGEPEPSRVAEGYEILLERENPWRGHRRGPCGRPHPVPVCRVVHRRGRRRLDRRFRPPRAK